MRRGDRTILHEIEDNPLHEFLAGQLPYYYREPSKMAVDIRERMSILEFIRDTAAKAPTTVKFQTSHCGEILSSLYLEDILSLRRLYCKLSLLTAENTNAHKMDGFFVDTSEHPFTYYAVEAKCSVQPTPENNFSGHRHGILKHMLVSLSDYTQLSQRIDFTNIRDHLEQSFTEADAEQIRRDLRPPGPTSILYVGIATINSSSVNVSDDDYILSESCNVPFDFCSLVVEDLRKLATDSYGQLKKLGE